MKKQKITTLLLTMVLCASAVLSGCAASAASQTDRKRDKAQRGRGPQLLCPRRHGSGDTPCAAFLGGNRTDAE